MTYEKEKYEIEEIWNPEWFSESDKKRFESLATIVEKLAPKKVVDVGCGNGLFLNQLRKIPSFDFERLCGVDRSSTALKHVKTESVLASIDSLPFNDNEFDIVTCLEVIEHLSIDLLRKSLCELSRISSRYILISVPFNENLRNNLIDCPHCYTKFNPWYHVHSFDKNEMNGLLKNNGFKTNEIGFIGEKEKLAFSRLIRLFPRSKNNIVFPTYAVCPLCGYNENSKLKLTGTKEETELKKNQEKVHGIKSSIKRKWPKIKSKKWIYGLYEKV